MKINRKILASSLVSMSIVVAGRIWAEESPRVDMTEEIIVTARRVEERAQDVPISMTVFNQEQLDNNNIFNATDIAQLTPSMAANQKYGPDNTTFSIRGFFQELRTTASVGVYFADVIAQRAPGSVSAGGDGAGPGAFFDLQNVQVLKGPQGTLFGRNTTGGAVLLVPRKPTDEFEAYIEGAAGNYDLGRIQGVLNMPISENIKFRAGIDSQERDGYLKNHSGIGPDDFGNVDYVAGRASLVIDLSPTLENYTIGTFADSNHNGYVAHLEEAIPSRVPLGPLAEDQLIDEAGSDIYDVANTQPDATQQLRSWQVINTTTWNVNDNLTVKNIIAYGQIKDTVKFDPYGTNFILPDTFLGTPTGADAGSLTPFATLRSVPNGDLSDQANFVEEFQLQGQSFDDRLAWQTGIYYERSDARGSSGTAGPASLACDGNPADFNCEDVLGKYTPIGTLFGTVLPPVEGAQGLMQWQTQKSDFKNIAAYAQGTFDFTEKLSATAGIRYTKDKVDTSADKYVIRFPDANDPRVYCKTPGLGYDDPTGLSLLGIPPDFDNAPYLPTSALSSGICGEKIDTDSGDPTWTLGLEYKLLDEMMVYAKYSRGYRQGSTNPFSLPGYYTFKDEKVDVYEAGVKTQWYGNFPGYLNIVGYYNDFSDQQIQAGALVFGLAPNAIIINAGESEMYGTEIEAGLFLTDNIKLGASYGYLHTKLKKADLPENTPTTIHFPTSTPGTALPLSPEHQLTLTATYELPVDESVGFMDMGITYSYTDDQFFTFSNYPKGEFPSYELVNLHFNWRSVGGGPVDLALFGTNVLDEEYIINVNEQTSSGFVSRTYGPPAMYGARIRYNF